MRPAPAPPGETAPREQEVLAPVPPVPAGAPRSWRRPAIHFATSAVLATVVLLLVAGGQRFRDQAHFQEQRALKLARVVAAASVDLEPEALQTGVAALPAALPGLREALVLRGVKLAAHTGAARAGVRLDRDSVADKDLYDRAARLRATTTKNEEERARNPALVRDAYAEAELSWSKDRGSLLVAAPASDASGFRAMAQVVVVPVARPVAFPWALVLVALGAAAIFLGVARFLEGAPLLGAGALLLAATLAVDGAILVDWRDGARRTLAAAQADTVRSALDAGLGPAEPEQVTALAKQLATDEFHAGVGDVGELRRGATGTWQVEVPASHLDSARARDGRSLLQWGIAIWLLAALGYVLGARGQTRRGWDALVEHRWAYAYLGPAVLGLLVLVFIPVLFGLVLGFMERRYNVFEFVGLANYVQILTDAGGGATSFYFTLGVTLLWTVLNVALHVSIGLFLALLLNDQMLKARGIYRVILIVPWAIPNYITALIWKGMFHKQFGAINHLMAALGLEPVSWFQSFWPAFSTNVITNTWLGFPFMMVISLGALQSIPADLYEAAWVDGANRWQRFSKVTLPLLMPALVPAVIIGFVWTFNMFNIIYLVSGGAPDGKTDILITDAFRWAFERDRYGYAAAYSTLIFAILLSFTLLTNRFTKATKSAFE